MIPARVAKRYARALADFVFARNEYVLVQEELHAMSELIQENSLLREAFANPAIARQEKERLLETLLARTKPSKTTANFLRVLLKHDRLHDLDSIDRAFAREMDDRLGIAHAELRTARPLSPEALDQVKAQLERMTGKRVRVEVILDPNLIGGLVARVGSEVYDGSIRTRLEIIKKQLIETT